MAFLLVRIMRMIPLIVFMLMLAAAIYLVVTFRHSPAKAKEVLIRVFTWFNALLIGFFGVASIYALFESNMPIFEIAISCSIVGAIGLCITLWCRHVFWKNNPGYKKKPMKATTKRRWPWQK